MVTIPFRSGWITSDKLDIHAIYRRPSVGPFGVRLVDGAGIPLWDLTGALPVRRHNDWAGKGFEYVSLATWQDVLDTGYLRDLDAESVATARALYETRGDADRRTFRVAAYRAALAEDAAVAYGRLGDMVRLHGPEAVEAIIRATAPGYVLPEDLRRLAPVPAKRGPGRPRKASSQDEAPVDEAVEVA